MVDKKDTKMLLDFWKWLMFMKYIEEHQIWGLYKGREKSASLSTLLFYNLFNEKLNKK